MSIKCYFSDHIFFCKGTLTVLLHQAQVHGTKPMLLPLPGPRILKQQGASAQEVMGCLAAPLGGQSELEMGLNL